MCDGDPGLDVCRAGDSLFSSDIGAESRHSKTDVDFLSDFVTLSSFCAVIPVLVLCRNSMQKSVPYVGASS